MRAKAFITWSLVNALANLGVIGTHELRTLELTTFHKGKRARFFIWAFCELRSAPSPYGGRNHELVECRIQDSGLAQPSLGLGPFLGTAPQETPPWALAHFGPWPFRVWRVVS